MSDDTTKPEVKVLLKEVLDIKHQLQKAEELLATANDPLEESAEQVASEDVPAKTNEQNTSPRK